MKLRRLVVDNYRAIRHVDLRFDDELGRIRPITVLAGPNGCGKTSIMFAILQALRGVMGYRNDDVPDPSLLDLPTQTEGSGWSRKPTEINVKLELDFGESEMTAIQTALNVDREAASSSGESGESDQARRLDPLPQGQLKLVWRYPPERNPDGTTKPWWFISETTPQYAVPWLYGRKCAIRHKHVREIVDGHVLEQIGGILLFPQDRNLVERVVGQSRADSGTEGNGLGRGKPRSSDIPIWSILEYLHGYVHSKESIPEEKNWESRIRRLFNKICAPKEYVGFMWDPYRYPDGAPCFSDASGGVYPLELAASGEQVILEYITRLTYPQPLNNSLILIDEPEVHLHPGWTRQLYLSLRGLGEDNQFILATHSPELRSLAAEDGALVDLGHLGE